MSAPLTLLLAGHVDHGKSTLAAALLHALGQMPEGKAEAIAHACAARDTAFEWAFALDSLAAERAQNVTMDAGYIWLTTPRRRLRIIDAPGHQEFIAAMMTGATQADAALLVADAAEGLREQTRRHAYLLHMLGITQIVIAVNKMDAVSYSETAFQKISTEITRHFAARGKPPIAVIPISAREGEGLGATSNRMPWYKGPALLAALDKLKAPPSAETLPLRLPVQDVYKHGEKRVLVGRIESGSVKVGDEIILSPSQEKAHIASIETWPNSAAAGASAGQSIGLTLREDAFVQRGMVLSHVQHPPALASDFSAHLFWFGQAPIAAGASYTLRAGTAEAAAKALEAEALDDMAYRVRFQTRSPLPLDLHTTQPRTGRFVIMQRGVPVGGGMVERIAAQAAALPIKSAHITPHTQAISIEQRARANGHLPGIFWFSGLSGAGKSTLAQALQKTLFARGAQVFVLDGDNLRAGLSRDLGFSPQDRRENLRRAAEVAALFAQSGFIVIAAFISPTEEGRLAARACAPDWFHDIYIRASLAACEQRDAKGLYALARSGKITEFTGISAPFEEPGQPDLTVDTEAQSIDASAAQLLAYIERCCMAPLQEAAYA